MTDMKLGVLVQSSDRYITPWAPVWWACWEAYSGLGEILFVTTSAAIDLPHVRTGQEGWCRRLLAGLAEIERRHHPEVVLFTLEDLLVGPREPGAYGRDIGRCLEIFRTDPKVVSISLARKDPELAPYQGWPEILGLQDYGPGIVPISAIGWPLLRPHVLRRYLERTLSEILPEADLGRNGAVEFEVRTMVWAKEANDLGDLHLVARRAAPSPVSWLAGVGATDGHLQIESELDLSYVDEALRRSGFDGGLFKIPGMLETFPLRWKARGTCPSTS